MGDSVILWLLSAFGVLAIFLFCVKGFLDALPDVFASWHRARRAWKDEQADESLPTTPSGSGEPGQP